MPLIFFGTSTFAVPALRALAGDVVLVVSQPDRPGRRGMRLQATPVKEAALELGLPVEAPEKSRSPEFVERLESLEADALVVAAYGQILSQRVLDSAKRGGINLHGSILPKYRGAAPIQRCILDGETETGVTLMQMDRGMDTGDMIEIGRLAIGPDETYGELQDRLAILGAEMAVRWMPRIVAGNYPRTPQDSEQATMAPKIEKAEAELRFDRDAAAEYNRFRAFTPSPGAFLQTRFGVIRIGQARLHGEVQAEPGTLVATDRRLVVAFAQGGLELLEIQPEGKKRMRGSDFTNGARLRPGDRLH
ncbi:methionyl-tRNA formyltransferase [Fimbriimonas ginsengisoli]|uniref:Methionyl-tRNA formyltransferase n=1 Tax=Fimbriimonas ginsengisoli Gsoil 348 TaxID=661478 RepID=A0A068NIM0_FIMGI|nr:methionyl-tRNA formyltransferase [Fimbriimonas ginsengisoli]AIE83376.1 methionyl-tRNA formyltransferase [Fimbriimonas ginsengisoli Gsoil 348]